MFALLENYMMAICFYCLVQSRCNWLSMQEAKALFSKVTTIHQHPLLMRWPAEAALCQNPIKFAGAFVQNLKLLTRISDMSSEHDTTKMYRDLSVSGHPCAIVWFSVSKSAGKRSVLAFWWLTSFLARYEPKVCSTTENPGGSVAQRNQQPKKMQTCNFRHF